MSAFVTETLPEDLSVAVFSKSAVLSDVFVAELEKQGLSATLFSSDNSSLEEFLAAPPSTTWYKVFWIDDTTFLTLETAKLMLKVFKILSGMSYVVMHQPFTAITTGTEIKVADILADIKTLFTQRSPYTTLLAYRDILSGEIYSFAYQHLLYLLHDAIFPVDQDIFSFLTEKEAVEGIVALSFDPRGGKRKVVIGKKEVLAKSLLKVVQREFSRKFKGEELFIDQPRKKVTFDTEFQEVRVPSSVTIEEMATELVIQAKFHYQPPTVTLPEKDSDGIPKPHIPKPKVKVEPVVMEEFVEGRGEVSRDSAPPKVPSESTHATKTISQPRSVAPIEPVSRFSDSVPLPAQQPVRETSIQVKVEAPLVNTPRAPILIPEPYIPEIKRSKVVLNQIASLEKPVEDTHHLRRISFSEMNTRVMQKVMQEQKTQQERLQHTVLNQDVEKKRHLEKKISTLFSSTLKEHDRITLKKIQSYSPVQILFGRKVKAKKRSKTQKTLVFVTVLVVFTSSIAVGAFVLNSFLVRRNIELIYQSAIKREVVETPVLRRMEFTQSLLEHQLSVYSTVLGAGVFSSNYEQLDLSKKLVSLNESINQLHDTYVRTIQMIVGAQKGDPSQALVSTYTQTENAYKQMSVIEASLKKPDSDSLFVSALTADQQKSVLESLGDMRRQVLVGQQLSTIAPELFAKDKKKVFAVVLQDSTELRPTGGFIQQVALVTVQSGQISDIHYLQPDEIAKSIDAQIAAPEEVREYLSEDQFLVHDANWSPSFDATAKQIAWFIEKGTNTAVDGVVAIDTQTLKKMIPVFGSIQVAEFSNENVTEKNFLDRVEFYAKQSGRAGESTDFQSAVFKSILQKMKSLSADQTETFMDAISELLKQSDVLIQAESFSIQSTISNLGWSGGIISPPCPAPLAQDQCLVSRVFQVDSNVGVNKVNPYIKKKVDHVVEVKPTKTTHIRTISYENTSKSNSWPEGAYKNYIRWYISPEAVVNAISVNGKALEKDEIKEYEEKNSKVVGALVNIPPGAKVDVVFEYSEPALQTKSSIALFDQKQSGTGNTPTKITVKYDDQYVPTVIAPKAQISQDKIVFSFFGSEHNFAGVKFK